MTVVVFQCDTYYFKIWLDGICVDDLDICILSRAVTVADFYHRGGNGPTTAGGVCIYIYIYILGLQLTIILIID